MKIKKKGKEAFSEEIKSGDFVYNPLSNVVIPMDDEDDLEYANDNYFKVLPQDLQLSIDEESVNIYFEPPDGTTDPLHVVYWHLDEIKEDASVALSIANAIHLFYTNPAELLKRISVIKK